MSTTQALGALDAPLEAPPRGRHLLPRSPVLLYIGRRLLQAIPVLLGVSFITFGLMNLLPGDAADALLGGTGASFAQIAALRAKLGLDHPFLVRYLKWLGNMVTGHLGYSLYPGAQPVASILKEKLPVSAELIVLAFIMALILCIPVALLAARWPRGVLDRLSLMLSMFGLSCPAFVLGLLAIFIFAVHLNVVPAIGWAPLSQGLWSNLHRAIMPAGTLAFGLFAGYTRLLRADLVEQMTGEDYIETARAKGVRPWRILWRHALRNSVFGLLTLVGLNVGTLIGGTVIIEEVFGLPGVGSELLFSINNRDVITVEAIVVLLSLTTVIANLLTDLVYGVLDPRIRVGSHNA